MILTDEELDLGMREADLALRLREPLQPDLIRRRLFTVHYHAYASTEYLKRTASRSRPTTSTTTAWSATRAGRPTT